MVSQAEYEGIHQEQEPRETAVERENRYLRRRLDQIDAEKLGLTVEQLEAKRFAELCASRPAPESDAIRAAKLAIEQAQARQNLYLAHYGVPDDADANLKLVLCNLNTDARSQVLFRSLIAAIAGVDRGESTSLRDIVAWWPSLSPEVGESLGALALHCGTLYRSAANSQAA